MCLTFHKHFPMHIDHVSSDASSPTSWNNSLDMMPLSGIMLAFVPFRRPAVPLRALTHVTPQLFLFLYVLWVSITKRFVITRLTI